MLAAALVLAGCTKEEAETLDNIQLSSTYLSIPATSGEAVLTVTASEAWEFVVNDNWPEVITRKDGEETRTPSWLAADKLSGSAGQTTVTFSADAAEYGREIELQIKVGDRTQFLMVRQGSLEASEASCAEVIDGPDNKTYIVEGVVTAIANTTYGNWYLDDGTGEVYIYGTLDAEGKEQNFSSLNIEVGDVVKVSGPKTTYNTTIELVNVSVISVKKSLIKVLDTEAHVENAGGAVEIRIAYKGAGVFVDVPDYDWITYAGMEYRAGVPTKIETSPADTAIVKFDIAANPGTGRIGTVDFSSHSGANSSTGSVTIVQGAIDAVASEIIAGTNGATYRMSGYVRSIANARYGNFYLSDYSGEVYVYGTLDFESFGIKEGDIVTVAGTKATYNTTVELVDVVVETHIAVKKATVAEFLAAAESSDDWYCLTGEISEIEENTEYGNLYLKDQTGTVYVYGLAAGYCGQTSSKTFSKLGLEAGDTVTIIGTRSSYKGTDQMKWGFFAGKDE